MKSVTSKLVTKKSMKSGNETVIIMIRNGYGTGTKFPTKNLRKKEVGDAILEMLDESLKDAINGKQ
jgi:hypothetical protein